MTRILVQRGSPASSSSLSSKQNRSSTPVPVPSPLSSSASPQQQVAIITQVVPAVKNDNLVEGQNKIFVDEASEYCETFESKTKERESEDLSPGTLNCDHEDSEKNADYHVVRDVVDSENLAKGFGESEILEEKTDAIGGGSFHMVSHCSHPLPPPVPPPKPSASSNSGRLATGDSNAVRIGLSMRVASCPGVSSRSSPTGSRPSSPRSHCEVEGYNSADEHSPCFSSSYDDTEREHQFVIDIRRVKGLELRKMLEDGNCLFRAVADQVYGDSELYHLVRQMCIDYMEQERDHFSHFITEGITSYCKRKRRDKVYGNNIEIQALSEMYNRPIHLYSYGTEPINIFHGSYNTDTPPIRLSYHHGNHYNSLVDPRRLNIGAGLGFSCLQGANVDKDQVKAAIKAQQDQQIENALVAEGRLYSDLELTEQEIERMVIEASRVEYLADEKFKQQLSHRESTSSIAEPSSSAARSSASDIRQQEGEHEFGLPGSILNNSMRVMLSMGFGYLQVIKAYSIFGDDVDSMVCYLIKTNSSGGRKGKATK